RYLRAVNHLYSRFNFRQASQNNSPESPLSLLAFPDYANEPLQYLTAQTHALRHRLGDTCNPWCFRPRISFSHDPAYQRPSIIANLRRPIRPRSTTCLRSACVPWPALPPMNKTTQIHYHNQTLPACIGVEEASRIL